MRRCTLPKASLGVLGAFGRLDLGPCLPKSDVTPLDPFPATRHNRSHPNASSRIHQSVSVSFVAPDASFLSIERVRPDAMLTDPPNSTGWVAKGQGLPNFA